MNTAFGIPVTATPLESLPLRRPAANLFSRRAARLQTLAAEHAMADFLLFSAELAKAQQTCFDELCEQVVNTTASLRHILARLQQQLADKLSPNVHSALICLQEMSDHELQAHADELRQNVYGQNVALVGCLPILGAAMQVQASINVRQTDLQPLANETDTCPACHGLPVASVLRRGESGHAVRYACCSLCASEWHITRVKCVGCGNAKKLQYRSIAASDAEFAAPNPKDPHGYRGVQELECCDECHGALKMISLERDANAEAFADDLASLTLDLLGGDAGYGRIGFNPYFLPGRE